MIAITEVLDVEADGLIEITQVVIALVATETTLAKKSDHLRKEKFLAERRRDLTQEGIAPSRDSPP